jgi:uncharacterized protein (TIGR00369 family)
MADTPVPPDPDYAERVRASFAAQGAMAHLGAELVEVAPGRCAIALPYRPELSQQDGFFHAGIVTTIVDSACGYAALTLMPAGSRVLTVELKLNLVAPARGERLLATGRVERAGRTLTVVRGEVEASAGDEVVTAALMQGTMICIMPRPG